MKLAKVFKENKQFTLFSILALVVVGVAVFAPQIAPYDQRQYRKKGKLLIFFKYFR